MHLALSYASGVETAESIESLHTFQISVLVRKMQIPTGKALRVLGSAGFVSLQRIVLLPRLCPRSHNPMGRQHQRYMAILIALFPTYLNISDETPSRMAKIAEPHAFPEASSTSYDYRLCGVIPGALDQVALLCSIKLCKGETHPRWLSSISRKTFSRHSPHDPTVMAVRKLQEYRRLLHCFSPMIPRNVETHPHWLWQMGDRAPYSPSYIYPVVGLCYDFHSTASSSLSSIIISFVFFCIYYKENRHWLFHSHRLLSPHFTPSFSYHSHHHYHHDAGSSFLGTTAPLRRSPYCPRTPWWSMRRI